MTTSSTGPQLGQVISYSYLWRHEASAGLEEGRKDRPCVVVLAIHQPASNVTRVAVVPITHRQPDDPASTMEIPRAVKTHLGLDEARSWIVLDELNEFAWPGHDLRPLPQGGFTYGLLPPRLFDSLVDRVRQVWAATGRLPTPRW